MRKSYVRLPIGLILPLVRSVEKTSIRKLPTRKPYVKLPIGLILAMKACDVVLTSWVCAKSLLLSIKKKVRPACDEISGADLKPEENFVPGIRSRFGLTGPTANLSQPEFVGRKIEHAWVSTLTRMFRTL